MTTFPENAASSVGSRPEGRIPPVVQVPQDHSTKPLIFIENPADYIGETVMVTARHALNGERGVKVCDCHEVCGALVVADGPLRGWDVGVVAGPYEGRHRWNVRRRSPRGGAR